MLTVRGSVNVSAAAYRKDNVKTTIPECRIMTNQITPMLKLDAGTKARLAIFMSGSGSNAERILEKARRDSNPPFEVMAVVTDAPETSRARDIAEAYSLPVIEHDIRAFYAQKGESRISIATARGQQIREQWTDALREKLAPLGLHFAVFAGFVPLTNITGDFPCLNVHPGDLTYLKDGSRHLVGLHTVPVERAILEGLDYMRSSVIQALPYTGKGDDMDNGPILGISGEVPIDLRGHSIDQLRECALNRPGKRPRGGFGDVLEQVADYNLEALKVNGDWIVLPSVVFDYSRAAFGTDSNGRLHYRIGGKWHPIETVIYEDSGQEIVFASA
jgi:folate-dependent phosphoribosylglycinamide formyltransferase PurN